MMDGCGNDNASSGNDKVNVSSIQGKDNANANVNATVNHEGTIKKRKSSPVDESFERIFGYRWGTKFYIDEKETSSNKVVKQLIQIFGTSQTARILSSHPSGPSLRCLSPSNQNDNQTKEESNSTIIQTSSNGRKRRVLDYKSIQLPDDLLKKTVETKTETKVFAGQVIQVPKSEQNKVVPSNKSGGSTNNSNNGTNAATAGGGGAGGAGPPASKVSAGSNLDQVLAQISGPSKLSTVQKTSNDWEQFKEGDKQLQDELEKSAQGKDAFLVKQDFLSRVDQRKFQLERGERERERAKRGTGA